MDHKDIWRFSFRSLFCVLRFDPRQFDGKYSNVLTHSQLTSFSSALTILVSGFLSFILITHLWLGNQNGIFGRLPCRPRVHCLRIFLRLPPSTIWQDGKDVRGFEFRNSVWLRLFWRDFRALFSSLFLTRFEFPRFFKITCPCLWPGSDLRILIFFLFWWLRSVQIFAYIWIFGSWQ